VHCRNIEANSTMAVAVFASTQRWNGPGRGIQFFGTCARAAERDAARAEFVYGERFSPFAALKASIEPADAEYGYRFYRFVATKLKVLDEAELGEEVFVEAGILVPH